MKIDKTGKISTTADRTIDWSVTINPTTDAQLPLRNVEILDTDFRYGFGSTAQYDYGRTSNMQIQFDDIVIEKADGTKLIKDTDYTIWMDDWNPPRLHILVNELTETLIVRIPTYVPDGFENSNNEVFYGGNKASVEIPGTSNTPDMEVVRYSNNEHSIYIKILSFVACRFLWASIK